MTETDLMMLARNGKELLVGFLLPFAVLYLSKLNWKTEYKLAFALAASLVGGIVIAFADGQVTVSTVSENLAVIFTAAQSVYALFFKKLGLEAVLLPQAAVVDQATTVVKEELSDLTREEATKVLDKTTQDSVVVTVEKKS